MENQVADSFDYASVVKMVKGAVYALSAPIALIILNYLGTLQIGNVFAASFMAWFVPVMVNVVKEWQAGQTPVEPVEPSAAPPEA